MVGALSQNTNQHYKSQSSKTNKDKKREVLQSNG